MFKKIIQKFVVIVQKILITILLFLVYLIGFGITSLFAILFNRKLFGVLSQRKNSFWKKAEGYENDMDASTRPS